jgi:hypothetical protein
VGVLFQFRYVYLVLFFFFYKYCTVTLDPVSDGYAPLASRIARVMF